MKQFYTKFAGVQNPDAEARVGWLRRNYDRYETYWRPEIEMAIRNARMYWAVNFGQWPMEVVEKLRSQGRRPPTFPVIPDKIETLVGNFLANTFEIKLEPRNNKISTLTLKMQDILSSDKNNMDWETAKILCLLDSFIKVGHERLKVSNLKDPFGNIAFENLNPRHVYLQPGWRSPYIRDLKDYFVWERMSIAQIKSTYKKTSERLNELEERERRDGLDYGISNGPVPRWHNIEEKWTCEHLVFEYHHVQEIDRWWEYDKKNQAWFPDNPYKPNSNEDKLCKLSYAQQMKLSPDDIVIIKQQKRVKFVEAVAPDIDKELFLDKGKDIVQTNNCNIYPLGIRYYGHFQGVVDRLYDLQIGINKGEMNIQDIQARSAKGAFILDRALTGGDAELEQQIEASWNDPAARIWVDENATERLSKGGIIALPGVTPSPDNFNQTNRYYDLADRFSKVPAAQDARTESNTESGRLYKFKFEAGNIQQKYLTRFYEGHERDKTEGAIAQSKITYAGVPRTFPLPGGKESFTINEEAIDLFSGRKVILDDISSLPDVNVILIPAKSSVSIRDDIKRTAGELLMSTEDPLIKLVLQEQIVLSSELVGDEEGKEKIKNAFDLAIRESATAKAAVIKQNQMNCYKIDAQLDALKKSGGLQQPTVSEEETPPEQQMTLQPPEEIQNAQAEEGTPIEMAQKTA